MTWLLIVYLLALVYFAANPNKISDIGLFRGAWICFALIPMSHFVFALLRAGNARSTIRMAVIEILSDGISWLFISYSLLFLINALIPKKKPSISLQ